MLLQQRCVFIRRACKGHWSTNLGYLGVSKARRRLVLFFCRYVTIRKLSHTSTQVAHNGLLYTYRTKPTMTLNIDLIAAILNMTDEATGGDFEEDMLVEELTQMTRPELKALIAEFN